MGKSPAFRFYASDFVGSPDVQAMDLEEVGAYVLMICAAWQFDRHGYLPDDDEKLRRWARMSREQWARSKGTLLAKFPIVEDGWRANQRLVSEAQKQIAYSLSQSKKGKQGGRPKKAGALSESKPELSEEEPEVSSGICPEKPSVSVSVSASVSDVVSDSVSEAITTGEVLTGFVEESKISPSKRSKKPDAVLPPWLDREAWDAFERHRKGLRKPLTDDARVGLIKKLAGFESRGISSTDALNESICNGWAGVFEPHDRSKGVSHAGKNPRNFESIAESNRGACELLEQMDTPAYLGGRGPQARTTVGQVCEGVDGPALAADAKRDRPRTI